MAVAGCSGDDTSTATTIEPAVVPDSTALAPGECDPAQTLAAPEIITGGTTTPATLGIGDFDCGGLSGDGYISFNYNPVLIDGEDTIEVTVGEETTAAISWTGDQPFTESAEGHWTSTLRAKSCNRITIQLTGDSTAESTADPTAESTADSTANSDGGPADESGVPTAIFGADVRVGGDDIECPQREIDPSDPSDGTSDVSDSDVTDSDVTSPDTTGS